MTRRIEEADLLNTTEELSEDVFAQGKKALTWAPLTRSLTAQEKMAAPVLAKPLSCLLSRL